MTTGLLLIHAFPLDARMWGELATGPAVVAPAMPGFGGTPPTPGGVMTMASAATRCLEAIDEAGMSEVVVVGLSMGGYVAFELWRTAPDRIAGLVLANTRAEADAPQGAQGRRDLAERLRREGNVLADSPPPLLGERADAATRERVRGWIADQPAEAIAAAALGMAERPDSTGDLAGISAPTLVITSDLDTLIPPEATAPLAERIPDAALVTIEGAGHLSNVERPDLFDDVVRAHARACGVGS
jgi:pimeloyl-ACP methyl ester carboxylesterase